MSFDHKNVVTPEEMIAVLRRSFADVLQVNGDEELEKILETMPNERKILDEAIDNLKRCLTTTV